MWARGLPLMALIFCTAALQLIDNGMNFLRIEEELSWSEALWYCQLHYTDLADLHSMTSLASILRLYSLTSRQDVWIGLYFNVNINGLVWSSGSAFTSLEWCKISLSVFKEGICGTVYATLGLLPTLGAAPCTTRKPFICYHDIQVDRRITTKPSFSPTASSKAAVAEINGETFMRFEQRKTWMEALRYCRSHHTDLADLQRVNDTAGVEAVRSITTNTEAWIGLYFNAASASLSWSSDRGHKVPDWLQVPQMGVGLCAGLGIYARYLPRVYSVVCSLPRPFICFHDQSAGLRASAAVPLLFVTHSSEAVKGTALGPGPGTSPADTPQDPDYGMRLPQQLTPQPPEFAAQGASADSAVLSTAAHRESPGSAWTPELGLWTPPGLDQMVPFSPLARAAPENFSDLQEETRTPLASPSNPAAGPASPEPPVTQSRPGTSLEAAWTPSRGSAFSSLAAHQGTSVRPGAGGSAPLRVEEQTSESSSSPGSPAVPQRTTAGPGWAARPEAAGSWPEPETGANSRPRAGTSEVSDTERKATAPATQAQHLSLPDRPEPEDKAPAPESGQHFGILRADFNVPDLTDPEEMKDQFLSEIQEALKFTLGHQQFRLKWVNFEVNKK